MCKVTTGMKLREVRKHVGMTQQQLADGAGVSRNIVSRIENDKGDPLLSTLLRLYDALGYSLSVRFIPKDS
jgi:y4mF family transcriptional regulator